MCPELQKQVQDTIGFFKKVAHAKKTVKPSNVGVVTKETTVGLGVTVMGALTYMKVQSTRTQLKTLKIKARRVKTRTM